MHMPNKGTQLKRDKKKENVERDGKSERKKK